MWIEWWPSYASVNDSTETGIQESDLEKKSVVEYKEATLEKFNDLVEFSKDASNLNKENNINMKHITSMLGHVYKDTTVTKKTKEILLRDLKDIAILTRDLNDDWIFNWPYDYTKQDNVDMSNFINSNDEWFINIKFSLVTYVDDIVGE